MKCWPLLFMIFFQLLSIAMADDSHIGRVVLAKGSVTSSMVGDKTKHKIDTGDYLYEGDEINTGDGSFVKIIMNDDTLFQMGSNTKFIMERFKMKTKSKRIATYNLVRGKLRSLFTIKSPKKTLKIKTPTAAMGVRGTEIVSDVYKLNGVVKTDIALLRGKLDVENHNSKKIEKLVPGDIFINFKNDQIKRGVANVNATVSRMPDEIFSKLKKAGKKDGQVFLFDALEKVRPEVSKSADFSFDPTKDDRNELKFDNPEALNNQRKKNETEQKVVSKTKEYLSRTPASVENDEEDKVNNIHKKYKNIHENILEAISSAASGAADQRSEEVANEVAEVTANRVAKEVAEETAESTARKVATQVATQIAIKAVEDSENSSLSAESENKESNMFDIQRTAKSNSRDKAMYAAEKAARSVAESTARKAAESEATINAEKKAREEAYKAAKSAAMRAAVKAARESGIPVTDDVYEAVDYAARESSTLSARKAAKKAAKSSAIVAAKKAAVKAANKAAIKAAHEAAVMAARKATDLAAKNANENAARSAARGVSSQLNKRAAKREEQEVMKRNVIDRIRIQEDIKREYERNLLDPTREGSNTLPPP